MKSISTALTMLSLVIWVLTVGLLVKFVFLEDLQEMNKFEKICIYAFSGAVVLASSYVFWFFGSNYWKNRKKSGNINFTIIFVVLSLFLSSCYPTAPDGDTYRYKNVFVYPEKIREFYYNNEFEGETEYILYSSKIYNRLIKGEVLQEAYFISYNWIGIADTLKKDQFFTQFPTPQEMLEENDFPNEIDE
jgi:hypothetical protein